MRNLYLLYHELQDAAVAYTYAMQTDTFLQHLDLFQRLRSQPAINLLPEITFDDGHVSDYEIALPALQARGMQALFFITAGWTGTRNRYMSADQLRALHKGGQKIGAHGWSHKLLTHCDESELYRELTQARLALEDHLGVPVNDLSLPGGRSNQRVLAACRRAGYTRIYTSMPKTEPIPPGDTVGRLNVLGNMKAPALDRLFEPESRALASLERQARLKAAARAALGDRLYARLWAIVNRQAAESGEQDTPPA